MTGRGRWQSAAGRRGRLRGRGARRGGAGHTGRRLAQARRRHELGASVERDGLVRTQTPQGARRELLLDAFEAAGARTFTDEAALLESRGIPVATVPGEPDNIKVTDPAISSSPAPSRPAGSESGSALARTAMASGPTTGCGSAAC